MFVDVATAGSVSIFLSSSVRGTFSASSISSLARRVFIWFWSSVICAFSARLFPLKLKMFLRFLFGLMLFDTFVFERSALAKRFSIDLLGLFNYFYVLYILDKFGNRNASYTDVFASVNWCYDKTRHVYVFWEGHMFSKRRNHHDNFKVFNNFEYVKYI